MSNIIKLSGGKLYVRKMKNEKLVGNTLRISYVPTNYDYILICDEERFPLSKNNNILIWNIPDNFNRNSVRIYIEAIDTENENILYETNKIVVQLSSKKDANSFSSLSAISNAIPANMPVVAHTTSPLSLIEPVGSFPDEMQYIWYNMHDEHPSISVLDRVINMPTSYEIVVLGDNVSQLLIFELNKFYDGVDLSTKACYIEYKNANGEDGKAIAVNIYADEYTLKIGWLLKSHVSAKEGNVNFKLKFIGYNDFGELYVWQSKNSFFKVASSISVEDADIEEKYPSIIEDMQIQLRILQVRVESLESRYDSIEIIPIDEIRTLLDDEVEVNNEIT